MQSLVKIDFGISVADSSYPEIQSFKDGVLILSFIDWNERKVKISFHNVVDFSWTENILLSNDERDDCIYEIIDSNQINLLIENYVRSKVDNMRHIKMNFNAHGTFYIIAEKWEINLTTAST